MRQHFFTHEFESIVTCHKPQFSIFIANLLKAQHYLTGGHEKILDIREEVAVLCREWESSERSGVKFDEERGKFSLPSNPF